MARRTPSSRPCTTKTELSLALGDFALSALDVALFLLTLTDASGSEARAEDLDVPFTEALTSALSSGVEYFWMLTPLSVARTSAARLLSKKDWVSDLLNLGVNARLSHAELGDKSIEKSWIDLSHLFTISPSFYLQVPSWVRDLKVMHWWDSFLGRCSVRIYHARIRRSPR